MWNRQLAARARAYGSGVLTVVEPNGYPASVRLEAQFDDALEVITFAAPPPLAADWAGSACLVFHRYNDVLEDLHELVIRGDLGREHGVLTMRPSTFLTGTGRPDTDAMPHAADPVHLVRFMLLGRRKARAYIARRGRPWPPTDFAMLVRVSREVEKS